MPTLCLQSKDTTCVSNPTYEEVADGGGGGDGAALYSLATGTDDDDIEPESMYTLASGNKGKDKKKTMKKNQKGNATEPEPMYTLASDNTANDTEPEPMYTLASGNEGNPAVAELAGCKIVSGRPSRRKGAETSAEKAQRLRLARDQMLTLPTRGEGVYTIDKKLRSSTDTTFGADVPDVLPFSPCLHLDRPLTPGFPSRCWHACAAFSPKLTRFPPARNVADVSDRNTR